MFYCRGCHAQIDTKFARVIRGAILCPDCRGIESKMNEITLQLVTKNRLISLARKVNASNEKIRVINTAITRLKEQLESLDYDFAERAGLGKD